MIVLLGKSASGKSYIENQLAKTGYEKIVSWTTRPIRAGELNGVDYHYTTDEKFLELQASGFFSEYTKYNGWYYGIAEEDCLNNRVVVVEPFGFRQLLKIPHLHIKSFYIQVDERERAIRMIKRGDNLLEVFRRIFSDQGVFLGIDRDVDYVINNDDFNGLNWVLKVLNQYK
jgi:guanylate kinase